MRRFVLVLALVTACGRKGFEKEIDVVDSAVNDSITIMNDGDPVQMDAPAVCTDGDGVCLFECNGRDSDCNAVCGDGVCTGNGGELCNTCGADCATQNTVCGNGACESSERTTGTCYADCGPGIWEWTAEEAMLIQLINNTRTQGFKCPGVAGGAVTRPPLTVDPALQPAAREWAWEIAHQNFFMNDGSACNGRTATQREASGGFTAYISSFGFPDVQATFNDWLSAGSTCQVLMSDLNTTMSVGVAFDLQKGYAFVLK
ncbi:MAG TPA: CAP domain-containing protein [Kofleriaceae bacterium]|nr:CAP domain-containing protein [Kofleriaceae bacterium]